MINLSVKETKYGNFLLKQGDYVDGRINKGEFFDAFLKEAYDHYLNKTSIVIDAGAYNGFQSVYLSKLCKKVYSFEPQSYIFYQLCGNLFINECYNVEAFNLALFSEECLMDFADDKYQVVDVKYTEERKYNYSEMSNAAGICLDRKENGKIAAITIDSLNLKELDFIKIDTQGCDLEIIKGGIKTINKYRPILTLEVDSQFRISKDRREDYSKFLSEKLDYNMKLMPGSDCDYICIPREEFIKEKDEYFLSGI